MYSVFNNNLSSGIRARGIVGFLSQPIKKQVRICNSFSDSLFGINLVHCTSSAAAPDRIHQIWIGPHYYFAIIF